MFLLSFHLGMKILKGMKLTLLSSLNLHWALMTQMQLPCIWRYANKRLLIPVFKGVEQFIYFEIDPFTIYYLIDFTLFCSKLFIFGTSDW